ncbi:MAG TPA: MFS transporter, partial [Candidatus Eisenbacteria bacterium]|nr:MFS transporter [Candidatus Eisenbacteria bacterium]
MSPVRAAWRDYREALGGFSRPARLLLLTNLLAWTCHGVYSVIFNLYLLEGGYREEFVGRAISLNGLGMALASLPAGVLADRWGRRRCLVLGVALDAIAQLLRASLLSPSAILAGSFGAGIGQAMLTIAAAPYMTEHSGPRERTHLFATFFASTLIAGVVGSILGGQVPALLMRVAGPLASDQLHAYRGAL